MKMRLRALVICTQVLLFGHAAHRTAATTPEHALDVLYNGAPHIITEDDLVNASASGVEQKLDWNGIDPVHDKRYANGFSEAIEIRGFSSAKLCDQVNRTEPIEDHTWCPNQTTFSLWTAPSLSDPKVATCWIDNFRAYYGGDIRDAPGSNVWVSSSCSGGPPASDDMTWNGQYDWRYGGIRPQDSEHSKLWPMVSKYIEDKVTSSGKKVLLYSHSGGTIVTYAFLRSQSKEWLEKNVLAYLAVVPVFSGTLASLYSALVGWSQGSLPKCEGRQASLYTPSSYWMWPRPMRRAEDAKHLWNRTSPIITTDHGRTNYTAFELEKLLRDMGVDDAINLLVKEQADLLDEFKAPGVDTYAMYGYGIKTLSAVDIKEPITPDKFGTDGLGGDPCPTDVHVTTYDDPFDAGDGVGPLRSTSRASQWSEEHRSKKIVNWNMGYSGMRHCEFCTPESKHDHDCLMNLFSGKAMGSTCTDIFKKASK